MKEKQQTQEALLKRIQELEAANASLVAEINQLKKAPSLGQLDDESGMLEEKAQQLIRLAPAAIYEIDFFGQHFIDVNDIACQWTGYSRNELLSMNPLNLMDDEGRTTLQNRIRRKLEGEKVEESVVYRIKTKDGHKIIVAANLGMVTYESGRPKSVLVVAHNITERKLAEDALHEANEELQTVTEELRLQNEELLQAHSALEDSEERLSFVMEACHIGAWEMDIDTLSMTHSKEHDRLYGFIALHDPWPYDTWLKRVIPEDRARVDKSYNDAIQKECGWNCEFRILRLDGQIRWIWALGNPRRDAIGIVRSMAGIVQDITERKQTEEQIRYQAALLSNVNDAIVASDANYRITAWNAAAETLYGWKTEEVIGRNGPDVVQTVWPDKEANEMRHTITEMGRWRGEATQVRKDGTRFPVEISSIVLHDNGGQVTGYVSVNRDITVRKQAEAALHRYELLSNHSRDIILFMRQEDGHILEANAAALRAYGYSHEEMLSLTIRDLRAPDTLAMTVDQMAKANAEGILFETTHQRKDGSTFPVEVSSQGATIGGVRTLISIVRDATERKRAEEQAQSMREMLKTVVDYMPASVCLIRGSDLRLQLVNPTYQSIAPGKEMVGHTLDELWPETGQDFTDICRHVLETGEPYEVVDELNTIRRQPDGPLEEAYFSWSLHRVRLSGDEGWGLLNTSWETTSRKRAEEALRESEAHRLAAEATKAERDRLYNVLEKLPAYTVLLSPDYHVPFANRFFRERFGESHGARCYEYLFHRAEPCEVCETFCVLKTNAPHHWDWVGPDERNYDVYDFPFTDSDGSPLIFEMGIDVTEMKQAQAALRHANETLEQRVEERTAALRESEERFSSAFRFSPVGVNIFRFSDGVSVDVNDAFLSLIEYSREELIGHSANELNMFVEPEQRANWMQDLHTYGAVRNLDMKIRGKSGRIVNVMFSIVKIELAGESMGLVMAIDITKRKQAEEQLRQHVRELAEANEDLARFNRVAVGRELRMIELKKQVNTLCLAAGQPPLYPLEFEKKNTEETPISG